LVVAVPRTGRSDYAKSRPRRAETTRGAGTRPPAARAIESGDRRGGGEMKVLYLATTGAADATKASIPLHIAANGSVEAGQECAVALAGDGTELVLRATAEHVEGVGVPPARELFQKLLDNEVPVFV